MVQDGSKPHTVRSRRKHPAKVGDDLMLYYGMRTKWCKKLRHEKCLKAHSIFIRWDGMVIFFSGLVASTFTATGIEDIAKVFTMHNMKFAGLFEETVKSCVLTDDAKNRFAWLDGFRPADSTLQKPGDAFGMMLQYWDRENALPFLGDVIYWSLDYENQ